MVNMLVSGLRVNPVVAWHILRLHVEFIFSRAPFITVANPASVNRRTKVFALSQKNTGHHHKHEHDPTPHFIFGAATRPGASVAVLTCRRYCSSARSFAA